MAKSTKRDKEKFLALARERFKKIYDAEYHIREAALEDLRFVYNVENGQWADDIITERSNDKRPCLTFNKLRKYVAQVANYEREQRLASNVRPVDDKSDPATAKVIEGIIRQIEVASHADEIYADTGEKAIAGGFGYWRIITRESDDSFDQEVFIEKIKNQFSVYLDLDKEYGFIRKAITKKEFENFHPNADMSSFEGGLGEEYELWYESDKVFIAEYFYKEKYDRTIAQVLNINSGEVEVIQLDPWMTPEELAEDGFQILQQKTKKATRVKWAKLSGHEILEEGEWAGKDIPIIEVLGDEVDIAGLRYKRSLIRDGKDPQRMFNYWLTHITETVALIPKSPYIVTPNEIKTHEVMWNQANVKTYPYLLYNPSVGGKKPQREPPPQIQAGSAQLLQIADANIQDTIGMYEASFGQRSNERTGVAIDRRAGQSTFGVFHFHDNFRRAILETTRQLIDIIPKIYDTERIQRIIGEEGNQVLVPINKKVTDEATGQKVVLNDLSRGKYDVVADVRLFATRRQEASQMMTETMKSAPNVAPLILDLVFKYQDWPGADEIRQRIQQYLPALLGQKETAPGQPGLTNTPVEGGMQ